MYVLTWTQQEPVVWTQQEPVVSGPVVRVQLGEAAPHGRDLTPDQAEEYAHQLLRSAAEARAVTGSSGWLSGEGTGVEWGVMLPGAPGEPPAVDVRDDVEDARATQDRWWGQDARLVRREVRYGPWAPVDPGGMNAQRSDVTTLGVSGVEPSASPTPQGGESLYGDEGR